MDSHRIDIGKYISRIKGKTTGYPRESDLPLTNGSRVAVIGGGPAGAFFSYFLLDMAGMAGADISVDIYEWFISD